MKNVQQNQEPERPLIEEEQKAMWLKEMEENEAIQSYFAGYHPTSIESFKDYYLNQKCHWLKVGPRFTERMETHGFQWVDIASEQMELILQKKLFDAQCLWRAEQLEIKEVSVCYEFRAWEEDVLNCPFIEPITASDLELFIAYVGNIENALEDYYYESWQDYDELKEAFLDEDGGSREFPDWYEFHNIRTGANTLMLLPDIRGEKEEFYMELMRDKAATEREAKKKEAKEAPESAKDERKPLYNEDNNIRYFVKTFEPSNVQTAYDSYSWIFRNSGQQEELEEHMKILYDADEQVAMEAHSDWAEAIKITAEKYRRKKIIEALPTAWEQYKMNIDMGIGFPPKREDHLGADLVSRFKEWIIEGRLLNGEAGDLNF